MRKQIERAGADIYDVAVTQPMAQMNMLQKMANRLLSLLIAYLIIMTAAAVMFAMIEGKNLGEGYWWASVTATTVGYGDTFPTHTLSKFFGAIFMHVCSFLIAPIITAKFAAHLIVNSDAFTHTEQEELKANARRQTELLEQIMLRLDALEKKS